MISIDGTKKAVSVYQVGHFYFGDVARKFCAAGHDMKLLPAQYAEPFVKSKKNDFNDALAIAEAVTLTTNQVQADSHTGRRLHKGHRIRI